MTKATIYIYTHTHTASLVSVCACESICVQRGARRGWMEEGGRERLPDNVSYQSKHAQHTS